MLGVSVCGAPLCRFPPFLCLFCNMILLFDVLLFIIIYSLLRKNKTKAEEPGLFASNVVHTLLPFHPVVVFDDVH